MHEKRITIRWRDMDAYGHVNNAVYLNYLEEARDEWLERALGKSGDPWDYVVARVAIDFKSELKQTDGEIVVRCALGRLGTSSLHLREEIVAGGDRVAARAESVLVAYDRKAGRSRPLTAAERAALEEDLDGLDV
ncbi:MAG TPA: thioesterase family protein [Candidatus Polarisedimenticolia bacterium]|nr:thioesterase family protein [Candidatus Polarisedimenticolia bacterium]